jgi:hypothetical protein
MVRFERTVDAGFEPTAFTVSPHARNWCSRMESNHRIPASETRHQIHWRKQKHRRPGLIPAAECMHHEICQLGANCLRVLPRRCDMVPRAGIEPADIDLEGPDRPSGRGIGVPGRTRTCIDRFRRPAPILWTTGTVWWPIRVSIPSHRFERPAASPEASWALLVGVQGIEPCWSCL